MRELHRSRGNVHDVELVRERLDDDPGVVEVPGDQTLALRSDTWYATITSLGPSYTPAGRWYAFITIPVFQFILLRWYYRIFIWFRLLFQRYRGSI